MRLSSFTQIGGRFARNGTQLRAKNDKVCTIDLVLFSRIAWNFECICLRHLQTYLIYFCCFDYKKRFLTSNAMNASSHFVLPICVNSKNQSRISKQCKVRAYYSINLKFCVSITKWLENKHSKFQLISLENDGYRAVKLGSAFFYHLVLIKYSWLGNR